MPVDRLIANQEATTHENRTFDAVTLYRLARLHALRATFGPIEVTAAKTDLNPVFEFPGSDTGIFQGDASQPRFPIRRNGPHTWRIHCAIMSAPCRDWFGQRMPPTSG